MTVPGEVAPECLACPRHVPLRRDIIAQQILHRHARVRDGNRGRVIVRQVIMNGTESARMRHVNAARRSRCFRGPCLSLTLQVNCAYGWTETPDCEAYIFDEYLFRAFRFMLRRREYTPFTLTSEA